MKIEHIEKSIRTIRVSPELPLVTVGVLSYNYSQYIEAALDSLLAQTYPHIELIIVDDCSTDRSTPMKIRNWIEARNIHCAFIENEKNLGITKVSNMIIERAKGKYLDLFATDDIMLPEKIERQVKILEAAGEEYGMCYANAETIDENGKSIGLFDKSETVYEDDVLEPYVFNKMSFVTPTALIRTSVYQQTGAYDERVLIEDYNFWIRLFAKYKVKYCPYPCLLYRVKQHSGVWDEWNRNNKERYYHDRILSNFQALQFISNRKVKAHLQKKISQYLKALAANHSPYLDELVVYLLKNRYFKIPARAVLPAIIAR